MNNMLETLTDFAELQAFASAQNKTIIDLSKKIKEKDEEIKHLKKLLEGSVPLIKESPNLTIKDQTNDQEYICRIEINKLKDISLERELTLEETKKLDIYCKILKELAMLPKVIEVKAKTISTEELIAAIASPEKGGNG